MKLIICNINEIFNSIWNFYFSNNGQINYPIISITLVVIFGVITLFWYFINSRRKLRIKTSYTASFEQNIIIGTLGPNIPLFSIYITNTSRRNIYIKMITIKLSSPIDSQKEYQHINIRRPIEYPHLINSLETFQNDIEMKSLYENLFSRSGNLKSFKIIVTDTLNKKYKSKSVKITDFMSKYNHYINS